MAATHRAIVLDPVQPFLVDEKGTLAVSDHEVFGTPDSTIERQLEQSRYLVVSPYTEPAHQLDLDSLDQENQLLARALVHMKCLRPDYATAPYQDTFNWGEIIETLRNLARAANHNWRESSFYIVAFRSQIPPTTQYSDLGVLDKAAHEEATASGGFLKYWFGTPDADGRNLATCVWRSRDDARRGGVGPAHRKASGATRSLYSSWGIDRHRLTITNGVESWAITEWVD